MALHNDPQHLRGEMYFPGLIEELRKYREGIHILEPPLEAFRIVQEAEAALKIHLPNSYKSFVQFANGARLFALPDGVEVFGVWDLHLRGTPPHDHYLVEWNVRYRQSWPPPRPEHIVTIGLLEDGATEVCLDLSQATVEDAPVIIPAPPPRKKKGVVRTPDVVPLESWPGLAAWLAYEMERGRDEYTYRADPLTAEVRERHEHRRIRYGGGKKGARGSRRPRGLRFGR